jgi:general secretion pathway protein G
MQTHRRAGQRRSSAQRRGLALIEVLVTVAIIVLISSAIALSALHYYEVSKKKTAATSAGEVRNAIRASFIDHGDDCPDVATLIARGALDESSARTDPWGTAWKTTCEGKRVIVSSAGPDRQFGTDDDIIVPSAEVTARQQ